MAPASSFQYAALSKVTRALDGYPSFVDKESKGHQCEDTSLTKAACPVRGNAEGLLFLSLGLVTTYISLSLHILKTVVQKYHNFV